jgi:hypothetical protein
VTAGDLTGTERSVLLVLMARCGPVANPELARLGPALDKPGRDKLNRLGLIESERTGNRYVHELTDRGWRMCRDLVDADPPPRASGPAKALHTVLGGLGRYLAAADLSLAEVFGAVAPPPPSVEEQIRACYRELADRPGGWVPLARLRAALDAPRDAVDAALRALHRSPGVSVVPQEKHLIAIEA